MKRANLIYSLGDNVYATLSEDETTLVFETVCGDFLCALKCIGDFNTFMSFKKDNNYIPKVSNHVLSVFEKISDVNYKVDKVNKENIRLKSLSKNILNNIDEISKILKECEEK